MTNLLLSLEHPTTSEGKRLSQILHIDFPLFFAVLILAGVGIIILYSACGQNVQVVGRQLIRLGIGLVAALIIAQITPHHIQRWTPWLYCFGIVLLAAVLLHGDTGKGAQRWLNLGIVRFQPSELMKIVVPMMIAKYLADTPLPPKPARLFWAAVLIVIPVLMIAKQPDLGTSLLVACAGGIVLFMAGMAWSILIGLIAMCAAMLPVLWFFMHDYQRVRVLTFLDPEREPFGAGYHIIQSKIAIGSGGMFGKGWLNGTQSHLSFLPERSTDFIFAVFSEEFGFVGVLLLLALYFFIIVRGIYIATCAQDTFTRLLAGSLTLTFFVYLCVNVGMVTGMLPVVGVPLPLVSYGGTAIVTLFASFGILMSIHTHRKLLPT